MIYCTGCEISTRPCLHCDVSLIHLHNFLSAYGYILCISIFSIAIELHSETLNSVVGKCTSKMLFEKSFVCCRVAKVKLFKVLRSRRTYIYNITHLEQPLNCTWKTLILISFYWLCVIIVTFSSGLIDTKALYFFLFISSSAGTQASYMFDTIVCYIV